jgi:hypothetical protein
VAEDDTYVVVVQFHRLLIHQGTQGNIHPNLWTNQDPLSQPKVLLAMMTSSLLSMLIVMPKALIHLW